jgi:hypothetical protein
MAFLYVDLRFACVSTNTLSVSFLCRILPCLYRTNRHRVVTSATTLSLVCWLVAITALAIGRDSSLSFILSPLVLLTGLWIVWILANEQRQFQILNASAIIFLFSLMLLFRGPIPPQKIRKLGIAPEEQAVLFLRRNFPENTRMAAYSIVPRAAKMKRVNLLGLVLRKNSAKQSSDQVFRRWIRDNQVEAVYLDDNVRKYETLWALIEKEIGDSLEIAFVSERQEVLRVSEHVKPISKASS